MAPICSWLDIDPKSHFSISNIPFGIISTKSTPDPHPAIAIGDYALDLLLFAEANGFAALSTFQPHQHVFSKSTLNDFAALGRPMHRVVREYLQSVLLANGPFPEVLEKNQNLRANALIPLKDCTMHLPMHIGDYTDFYAGLYHAYNGKTIFSFTWQSRYVLTLDPCSWRSLPRASKCITAKLQASSCRISWTSFQCCRIWYSN